MLLQIALAGSKVDNDAGPAYALNVLSEKLIKNNKETRTALEKEPGKCHMCSQFECIK